MAQVGQKSETWKQKRANMRASVSACVCACARVRVRARARARARSLMATLPGGGPAEDVSEFRSHACGASPKSKPAATPPASAAHRVVISSRRRTRSPPARYARVKNGGANDVTMLNFLKSQVISSIQVLCARGVHTCQLQG